MYLTKVYTFNLVLFLTEASMKAFSKDIANHPARKHSTSCSSRRTSNYTCAELLAIGATQGAIFAGFGNSLAMQNFYSKLNMGEYLLKCIKPHLST